MSQLVAIVGRPNVGKSTLFNRLTESRQAIVDETAGTTRDRQYGKVDWCGREFSIVDTGGWVVNSEDIFEEEINKQVAVAIEQADEVLFVVDAMNGVTDLDDHVAEILRKSKKPVILVANKVDSNEWMYNVPEFYSLGLGDPYPVSAVSGYGTALLYAVFSMVGFLIVSLIFWSLRGVLNSKELPRSLRGLPVTLLVAALISMAFQGFIGF